MKYFYLILITSLFCLIGVSCEKDSNSSNNGVDVEINPFPRGEDDFNDDRISLLRILIFESVSKQLAYNYTFYEVEKGSTLLFKIEKDKTYDFVFIGNENSDPTLSKRLTNFTSTYINNGIKNPDTDIETYKYGSLNDLELDRMSFDASAFDAEKHIPMFEIRRNVEIIDDRKYNDNGTGIKTGTWEIGIDRLGVRVDVILYSEDSKVDDFKQLEFDRLPKFVPMLTNKLDGTNIYSPLTPELTSNPIAKDKGEPDKNGNFRDGFVTPTADEIDEFKNEYGITLTTQKHKIWKKYRIIIPSKVFNPETDKDKGLRMKAVYSDNYFNSTVLGYYITGGITTKHDQYDKPGAIKPTTDNYNSPRNTYYTIIGKIVQSDIILNAVTVKEWGTRNDIIIID